MAALRIDIWSDIACPWCYVGKRRLEGALASFPQREKVSVVWRSFELNPSAPRETNEGGYVERLAKKYGTSLPEAQRMISRMCEVAKADGLLFDFNIIRPGNTFDAHRVLHLAALHGLQDAVKERFLCGYLTQGEKIGNKDTLLRLAVEAGLDAELVRKVLHSDAYSEEVRDDEREAQKLGITGVPFFLMAGRFASPVLNRRSFSCGRWRRPSKTRSQGIRRAPPAGSTAAKGPPSK